MRDSKAILNQLLDELGDALERDRGENNAFKAQVFQGLMRAQQALGTGATVPRIDRPLPPPVGAHGGQRGAGRYKSGSAMASQRSASSLDPLADQELITAHTQLRQVFRDLGQQRARQPKKLLA